MSTGNDKLGNDRLVHDLEKELDQATDKTKIAAIEMMLFRANTGFYGDFTSPIIAPKAKLIRDAQELELNNIASEAMKGRYNGCWGYYL